MDLDIGGEVEEKGGLESKGVSRATDFELFDYWNEGEVLSGKELWSCYTFVLSSQCCSVMKILPHPLIYILLVIERALFGRHAIRRSLHTIAVSTMDQVKDLVNIGIDPLCSPFPELIPPHYCSMWKCMPVMHGRGWRLNSKTKRLSKS